MKEDTILKQIFAHEEESKKHYTGDGKMSGGVYTADEKHW